MQTPDKASFVAVLERNANEVWVLDAAGEVYVLPAHEQRPRPTFQRGEAFWGDGTSLWMAGESGSILRRD